MHFKAAPPNNVILKRDPEFDVDDGLLLMRKIHLHNTFVLTINSYYKRTRVIIEWFF